MVNHSGDFFTLADGTHRQFKDRLYAQLARVGKAVSSPHRLEILELLAQGERTVDSIATDIGQSLSNTSQHMQALRQAALVDSRKDGRFRVYRLAGVEVFQLSWVLRRVARERLAEFERLVGEHVGDRADAETVPMAELLNRARSKQVVILDTRPASEYVAGHIAGAISVPVDDLQRRLRGLPKGKEYVAYSRGPYCVDADRAVELLRTNGRRARRLLDGFPEWRAAGLPVAGGIRPGALK